jgi:hypothetical protein
MGQESVEYHGTWWTKSLNGQRILRWDGNRWQPWSAGDSGPAPPPKLLLETNHALGMRSVRPQAVPGSAGDRVDSREGEAASSGGRPLWKGGWIVALAVVLGLIILSPILRESESSYTVTEAAGEQSAAPPAESQTHAPSDPPNEVTSPTELPSRSVPDVVERSLKLAERQAKAAGLKFKERGGGLLGVIDPRAWKVCDQHPEARVKTTGPVRWFAGPHLSHVRC